MSPSTLWRTVAIVAVLGWAGTTAAWMLSPTPQPAPSAREVRRSAPPRSAERAARRPIRSRMHRAPERVGPTSAAPDLARLRDEVRNEVLDEIDAERAERHQERREQHLRRLLDEVTRFADDNDLDADTRAALESSLGTLHDRLEELRPAGPPDPGGPSAEEMDAIQGAFDQFRDEVDEVVPDEETAASFVERMTPRPLRGPPRN